MKICVIISGYRCCNSCRGYSIKHSYHCTLRWTELLSQGKPESESTVLAKIQILSLPESVKHTSHLEYNKTTFSNCMIETQSRILDINHDVGRKYEFWNVGEDSGDGSVKNQNSHKISVSGVFYSKIEF